MLYEVITVFQSPCGARDLPDYPGAHRQGEFDPDGTLLRGLLKGGVFPLALPPFPLPLPGPLHQEKAPARGKVRQKNGQGLFPPESGPGDDMLEPADGEETSPFKPGIHNIRVYKAELPESVRSYNFV